jgi:hypothetical protein
LKHPSPAEKPSPFIPATHAHRCPGAPVGVVTLVHVAFAAHPSAPPPHVPLSHQPSSATPNSSDAVPSAVSANNAEDSMLAHVVLSVLFQFRKAPAAVAFGELEATHATAPEGEAVSLSPGH